MTNSDKDSRIKSILKIGIDPITIVITVVATLFFSIVGGLVDENTKWYNICDKGFYVSLSVIILQILLQNSFLKEGSDSIRLTIEELNKKSKITECVVFPEKKNYINNKIEDGLNSHIVRKMKIICYGTSKFGRIIDSIITTFTMVQVEVIVCSPDETFFDLKSDKQLLKNVIEELATAENIRVYASLTPPTVRACVMYIDNEKPIFCSMQSYYLFSDEIYKIFKGGGFSPSIIADSENEVMLMHLTEVFNKEFDRLKKTSEEITLNKIINRRQNGTW